MRERERRETERDRYRERERDSGMNKMKEVQSKSDKELPGREKDKEMSVTNQYLAEAVRKAANTITGHYQEVMKWINVLRSRMIQERDNKARDPLGL